MRLLLSKDSLQQLFSYLFNENKCKSLKSLSVKAGIKFNTLQKWKYGQRYIPGTIIPSKLKEQLIVLDKQPENWGRIKGGQKTYKVLLNKYGIAEIKRRQAKGGKVSSILRQKKDKLLELDLNNTLFLEFYGALLGDGWMSKLHYKGKVTYLIGISGNARLDREFFYYLKKNIKTLFNRNAYLKERPKYNSIELNFSHKELLKKMNEELHFPVGEKLNLEINPKIYGSGFEKVRHVIRGIFDTDGSFYFDKTPVGKPYPCINITMKAPVLIKQLADMLLKQGFRLYHDKSRTPIEQIRIKGVKQLTKWMREIGSQNLRHLNKYAPVAQSGAEMRTNRAAGS